MSGAVSAANRCLLAAAWMQAGGVLHGFSVGLSAAALVLIGLGHVAWAGVLVLGLLQAYFALRTAFDRQIFVHWAAAWQADPTRQIGDLEEFDSQLGRSGAAGIEQRIAGAMRLWRYQAGCLLLQIAAALAAYGMN